MSYYYIDMLHIVFSPYLLALAVYGWFLLRPRLHPLHPHPTTPIPHFLPVPVPLW